MEIVYIVHEYPTTSQTFVFREIEALREMGAHVFVFPLRHTRRAEEKDYLLPVFGLRRRLTLAMPILWGRLPIVAKILRREMAQFGFREGIRQLYALISAASLLRVLNLKQIEPDFVHAHFLARPADVARYIWMLSNRALGFSVTVHAADVYGVDNAGLIARRLKGCKGVIGISQHVLEHLEPFLAGYASCVVHCAVPFDRLPHPSAPAGELLIVSAGRLVAQKGFQICIDAARVLRARHIKFQWLIVGEGIGRSDLQRDIGRYDLHSHVHLLGAMPNDEVLNQMLKATCFVLPCDYGTRGETDGIPVVLMEAMALGIPVVTTPLAGIPELVQDGITGILVPTRDPEATATAIERLVNEHTFRNEIISAARQRVEAEFNSQHEARKLLAAFDRFHGLESSP